MEKIKIEKNEAVNIWSLIKNSPRVDNTDEQWGTPEEFYQYYDYENIVIQAAFEVLDASAEMDSNEFADWDNPTELYIVTDMTVL